MSTRSIIHQCIRNPIHAALLGATTLTLHAGCIDAGDELDFEAEFEDRAIGDTVSIADGVTLRLQVQHSGQCLQVNPPSWGGSAVSNGAKVVQAPCASGTGTLEQQFRVEQVDPGEFLLVAVHSGKCLDVANYSNANGGIVHHWACHNKDNQRWKVQSLGGNSYQIRSVQSNKCLDIAGVSQASGAQLQQWGCYGGGNQRFKGIAVEGSGGLPPGTHPDIVSISPLADTSWNPGGIHWADSFSHNGVCWCHSTNYDHGIGPVEVSTPSGTRTVFEVCEAQKSSGNKPERAPGDPIYNDVQCGNGPPNKDGLLDEEPDACPGRTDMGGEGCAHIGPKWDFSRFIGEL